jgi:hypothetical protein
MSSSEATACEQAHSRLIDTVVARYWSLPARGRGDFVVGVVNLYIHELATRRPDFSPGKQAQLTIEFGRALVAKIDYPSGHPLLRRSGHPLLRRLLAECEPAGRA